MKVLVCPLDWGLGHATRCVPLIRALRGRHQVVIGASGLGRAFLAREFPELEIFDFPGYRVRYSRSPLLFLPFLLLQAPGILSGLFAERRRLAAVVAARGIQVVISDGRYGCHSDSIPSVLVTHQIFIRIPGGAWARRALFRLNARMLRPFREVWVPDVAGSPNLSGELGHGPHGLKQVVYIGPLSRFPRPRSPGALPAERAPAADGIPGSLILGVVSGPEPQRGLFEAALRRELEAMPGTRVLVRGLPGKVDPARGANGVRAGNLNVFDHLDGGEMEALFRRATLVVSRSGYTTVMEMAALGVAQALLVPTPGQSEQEYLAAHLERLGLAQRAGQDRLDLRAAAASAGRFAGFKGFLAGVATGNPGGHPDGNTLARFLDAHPFLQESSPHIC